MSGKQKAVLWLGLILVALNLVDRWNEIKGVIFKGAGTSPGKTPSGSQPTNNQGQPVITVPIDPFIPGPTSPKITIPVPSISGLFDTGNAPQPNTSGKLGPGGTVIK